METNKNCLSISSRFKNINFREIIWPIHRSELVKFVPMCLLMFFILLSYNILRGLKDSLVMTHISPQVISFIKLWFEMPAGVLMVLLYSSLCNRMSTERAFRIILLGFVGLLALFAYVLYPFRDFFQPDPLVVEQYISQYSNFKWFIKIWGQWTCVAFYIVGELWPIVIFSLLFWQLANKITNTEEAKRFYSFFSLFGQSNLLLSGSLIVYFSSKNHILTNFIGYVSNSSCPTEIMVQSLVLLVILFSMLCFYLHYFIETRVIKKMELTDKKPKVKAPKLGLIESLKVILQSRYLWLICILLISYSTSVNLLEGLWFEKAKEYYGTTEGFIKYQGTVLMWTGVATVLCSFVGSAVIRYYGWFWGAITTPCIILCVGVAFFIFCMFEGQLTVLAHSLSLISPQFLIVFMGGAQNVLGKGTKYSLFDASKEMVYIPLDDEMKTKGKAAVDIVGAKIGKSIGAVLQCSIFTMYPSAKHSSIVHLLMSLFIIVCLVWIYSVKSLDKEYSLKVTRS